MKNIFIIGSKGIPANYGGFETFVEKLTEKRIDEDIKYHISCMANDEREFEYNGARCFNVKTPNIGPAKAVYYDILALKKVIKYIKEKKISDGIVYILACRVGPFIKYYKQQLIKLGIKIYVNPDGHEWKRSKWNSFVKRYWKISEKLMVKYSDLLICDSRGIEEYIHKEYKKYNPQTTFIAYGADIEKSKLEDKDLKLVDWLKKHKIKSNNYYLIVGRFVPENNYELMIKEFMMSSIAKDLVIITNIEHNKFYSELLQRSEFNKDKRIKFVGTVYEQELLKKIREKAYGYIHGHEVGGTNPSLLEALASTKINILLDVNFNREVGEDGAIYFSKDEGCLKNIFESLETISKSEIIELEEIAKKRIKEKYSWEKIIRKYERILK
ncbi:beta 1-4 rhamnosyltransferase Cps2T [Clostridium intestinale]|uniref:Rhamnosyltransferase n=1 Tax=Clostridium intestinale DSM 6191 TaxID=1121320 RepID=A0A1M6DLH3_9CLOT|nr:DUF1972 domain-containing protein [Clostridium intestinale]SHI74020.1 rhamnosyltransferase [Clostridium intestinale DSM 6191]